MNNFSAPVSSNFHSLVDWFALSGVTYEVAERTAFETTQQLRNEKLAEILSETPAAQPAKPLTKAPAPVKTMAMPEFNNLEELNNFFKTFRDLGLCKTASSSVIGVGSLTPRLMVITDSPEDQEDRSGLAFSGSSNQMIRKALGHAGIDESDIYYTYLSKWRTPGKRALTPQEVDVCHALLQQEIKLLRPAAILTLGESTLKALWPDSLTNGNKIPFINSYTNQHLNSETPFFASQKSEFLVKNALTKKTFWFGLLEFAGTIRT